MYENAIFSLEWIIRVRSLLLFFLNKIVKVLSDGDFVAFFVGQLFSFFNLLSDGALRWLSSHILLGFHEGVDKVVDAVGQVI